MKLLDIVQRPIQPRPWAEGEKIPWDQPQFSRRMLKEHLSQAHDAASRRSATIKRHVQWIHRQLLGARPARILDLGCGPGLYTSRLARLGHQCLGIDFSPASIAYARAQAEAEQFPCKYLQEDIRTAAYGTNYDLALLIFGEFNVFRIGDAELILKKLYHALRPGGLLLLEPHTFAAVRRVGEQTAYWYARESGLFSDQPHLCLKESFWDAGQEVATERYYIVDAASGEVTRYAASTQAYHETQYQALLAKSGFREVKFYPSLSGEADETQAEFIAITARK